MKYMIYTTVLLSALVGYAKKSMAAEAYIPRCPNRGCFIPPAHPPFVNDYTLYQEKHYSLQRDLSSKDKFFICSQRLPNGYELVSPEPIICLPAEPVSLPPYGQPLPADHTLPEDKRSRARNNTLPIASLVSPNEDAYFDGESVVLCVNRGTSALRVIANVEKVCEISAAREADFIGVVSGMRAAPGLIGLAAPCYLYKKDPATASSFSRPAQSAE
jgi:hypothetical protein